MTHVVTSACVDHKYQECVAVCPVEAFREADTYLISIQMNALIAVHVFLNVLLMQSSLILMFQMKKKRGLREMKRNLKTQKLQLGTLQFSVIKFTQHNISS